MRVILLICIGYWLIPAQALAQFTFQKTYATGTWEKANNIQVIGDKGYIIAGSTNIVFGDPYFIRINNQGDTLVTKVFSIADGDKCRIMIGNDNDYFIACHTTNFGAGNGDAFVIKTDTNLNIQWTKSYGGGSNDLNNHILQTSDSGLLIIGSTSSFGAGFSDGYVIRTDQNGDTLWAKTFGTPELEGLGRALELSNKRILVTGGLSDVSDSYMYVLMLEQTGGTIWSKLYKPDDGVTGNQYIAQLSSSSFIIIGNSSNAGITGILMMSIDTTGIVLWSKVYNSSNNCSMSMSAANRTEDGGFIIVGNYCSAAMASLMRVDSSGNLIWVKTYSYSGNSHNIFHDVKQAPDGGFIAVGETGDLFGREIYVVKTDANGNSGCGDSTVIVNVTNAMVSVIDSSMQVGSGGVVGTAGLSVSGVTTTINTQCFDTITGIEENKRPEPEMQYLNSFPNPFDEHTSVETFVPENTLNPELVIYNVLGIEIKRFKLTEGYNIVTVAKEDLPQAGIYLYALFGNNEILGKRKMVLLGRE